MNYLLSRDGRNGIEGISAEKLLVAFDFDGTLAPIVNEPSLAKMPAPVAQELERLCEIVPVAIISGRELHDLETRVSAPVAYLIGNHGNEGLAAITVNASACRSICAGWTGQLRRMPDFPVDGIYLEPKGFTLAVHYRQSRNHIAAQVLLRRVFAGLTPAPRVVHGKCVFDLIPSIAVSKDNAMNLLVQQTQSKTVLYIGDDECDELVFANSPREWITVRVGHWGHSAARYFLRYQHEIYDVLQLLNLQLRLPSGRN